MTYHSNRDESPCTCSPSVAEVVVHSRDEQRHSRTRPRTDDSLRCERRSDVAGEGVNEVGVRREVNDNHYKRSTSDQPEEYVMEEGLTSETERDTGRDGTDPIATTRHRLNGQVIEKPLFECFQRMVEPGLVVKP